MSLRIGIDLGGTKTEGILMDAQGNILDRVRYATPREQGYDAIVSNIIVLVRSLESKANTACPVGIGTPGALSSVNGMLKNSNTTCMNGKPLKQDIEAMLGREIRMENDANCFALSEAVDGAGKQHNMVFGVIMGTGVGGGIVFGKQLHSGPQHIAGEWGHNVVLEDGPDCYCGRKGCVETLISGPGLLATYRRLGGDKATDAIDVSALAQNGDSTAELAMQQFLDHFGKSMATVINILDPDAIVLGGGLSNIDRLYTEGRDGIGRYIFNDEVKTPILKNRHGDSAGVRGAAWLWPAD